MTMVQIHPNSLVLVKILITEITEKFSLEKLNWLASIVFCEKNLCPKSTEIKQRQKKVS